MCLFDRLCHHDSSGHYKLPPPPPPCLPVGVVVVRRGGGGVVCHPVRLIKRPWPVLFRHKGEALSSEFSGRDGAFSPRTLICSRAGATVSGPALAPPDPRAVPSGGGGGVNISVPLLNSLSGQEHKHTVKGGVEGPARRGWMDAVHSFINRLFSLV
jgi:hypothetical protein